MVRRRRKRRHAKGAAIHPGQPVVHKPAVRDRFGRPACVENLCLGGRVFLIGGGPSLKNLDLTLLDQRGVSSFGINNIAAGMVRPNFWTYGDTTAKFHTSIWQDPAIMKFVPFPKLRNPLKAKLDDGTFQTLAITPYDCPNVFGILRNLYFNEETWLHENTINWGHGKEGIEAAGGGRKTISSFFQGLRLCYYLGFRTVFLIGVDFAMAEDYYYAFDETKSIGAIGSNNASYVAQIEMLGRLKPKFIEAGFDVMNCNPNSALTVFDYLPFETAIEWATSDIPKCLDAKGWYGK